MIDVIILPELTRSCFVKIVLLALLLLIGCGTDKKTNSDNQQAVDSSPTTVEVIGQRPITTLENGRFYFPRYSPDDSKIFFTSDRYVGLSYYQITTGQIIELNDIRGAGYKFIFSVDGEKIYFRGETARKNRRRHYNIFEQDLFSKEMKPLLSEDVSDLSEPQLANSSVLVFYSGDIRQRIPLNNNTETAGYISSDDFYQIDRFTLTVWRKGEQVQSVEFKDHPLIWPEWSRTKDQFLVYATGIGLNLLNLEGHTILNLGEMRAAKWSPKNDLIVYMDDTDDGEHITASDIYVYDVNFQQSQNLTDTKTKIEMYPCWSYQGDEIVYNTSEGVIESIKLKIDEATF